MAHSSDSTYRPPSKAVTDAATSASAKRQAYSFEIVSKPSHEQVNLGVKTVRSYPLPPTASQLPMLPRKKRAALSSHRHDANPALAMKVLRDIQEAVEGWHQNLRQVLLDIQAIYMEGPMVEGWLETVQPGPPGSGKTASVLRHADPQELTQYVEHLCRESSVGRPAPKGQEPQYRLCSLDADGQVQCQICPPDQLPFVSMAIARHQKLRQHLNQKQYLEAKLKRAVEALSQVREELGITPQPDAGVARE
ncbi:MAG TPA: hypothetical protein V6D29_19205 [Leptolyngbyaceae cyanobacterium]